MPNLMLTLLAGMVVLFFYSGGFVVLFVCAAAAVATVVIVLWFHTTMALLVSQCARPYPLMLAPSPSCHTKVRTLPNQAFPYLALHQAHP